jgi:hypothetical protein
MRRFSICKQERPHAMSSSSPTSGEKQESLTSSQDQSDQEQLKYILNPGQRLVIDNLSHQPVQLSIMLQNSNFVHQFESNGFQFLEVFGG